MGHGEDLGGVTENRVVRPKVYLRGTRMIPLRGVKEDSDSPYIAVEKSGRKSCRLVDD